MRDDIAEELETDWEWKTANIRILSIPCGEFNPFKHGAAFSPYYQSPNVWVLQIREIGKNDKWLNIPIVEYEGD